ncbi:MAG: efflux RND transporter periplasmic adaptor subunit [Phycisphaerales bacterium]
MWKWLIAISLAIVGGLSIGGYFISKTEGFADLVASFGGGEKPQEVRLGKVEKGSVIRTVNAPGSIEPKTKVQISAQVAARVTALPFREGERVKSGDVVVRLDSRDLVAALESTQASKKAEEARLEGAKASMTRADAELARQRKLMESGDASKSALETAENEYLRAKSQVDSSTQNIEIARANIARAQKDLENTEIVAPFDGVITKLSVEVGELVLVGTFNNAGSVIMEIADLDVMLLKARVDEANIAPVKAGQKSKVFINAFRGRTFEGNIDRVGLKRIIDRDGTGYYEVEILVQKPSDTLLYSGLTANTDIEVETFADVLKVPSQAVVDRKLDDLPKSAAESPFVDKTKSFARVIFTFTDGKVTPVPVSVGPSDLTHTVLLGGIEEGTQIITGPFKVLADLKEGKKVAEEGTLKKKKDAAHAKEEEGGSATPRRKDGQDDKNQPAETKAKN